jgi:outer membrane protein TolC
MQRILTWLLLLVAWGAQDRTALAQTAAPTLPDPLTLEAALAYAADHYPALRAAIEETHAADAGVRVARTAYLPRLEALWQSNRGTTNNVFGQILPQSVIPSLSGPVLSSASSASVWGSATGTLLSWEPIDFGLRSAGVASAEAGVERARAMEALTRLEVEAAVATAYLDAVAAQRAVIAARADFTRRDQLTRAVHTLVDNQLRPGAEASRADAERVAAQTRLIQTQQGSTVAEAVLARVLGAASNPIQIEARGIIDRLPSAAMPTADAAEHPLARLRSAAVEEGRAQQTVLARSGLPRLFVQSSVFARGSGASPTGTFDGGAGGLALDRVNWAAGVQLQIPNLFDFASIHAKKAAAMSTTLADTARYDEAMLTVESQRRIAEAGVRAAQDIAANTPLQLASAQQTEAQARARYDAGLAGIVEIADAQNLLAQAELLNELARLDAWRATLAAAVARGRIDLFVDALRRPAGGQ